MNQKMKINKKSKKKIEFEFCKVCSLNHDQGRNHKYFTKHRNSLSNFLSRFQVKLADISANAISHLATEEHLKNLKHFMWKYDGGMDRLDSFRILEADVAKWEKKCEALRNEATVPSSDGLGGVQVGLTNGMSIRYPIQDSLQLKMSDQAYMGLFLLYPWTHVLVQVHAVRTTISLCV